VCVCVCARARACVCVCARARVCVCVRVPPVTSHHNVVVVELFLSPKHFLAFPLWHAPLLRQVTRSKGGQSHSKESNRSKKYSNMVSLASPRRTYQFSAPTVVEAMRWVQVIADVQDKMKQVRDTYLCAPSPCHLHTILHAGASDK
jgi:hypothetical protein